MRREPTEAEALMWEQLRAGRMAGHAFRRQHPLGRFVVDFYCPAAELVVELDGPIHDELRVRDVERDRVLAALGCRALRFSNEAVLNDLDAVLAEIRAAIEARA